ncbi:MAG TPA: shikimate kinase, partial [Candidatus Methylomirabilis sp.]|nr:shikimate kinase [Candidatus Methylomirabilis sp.]
AGLSTRYISLIEAGRGNLSILRLRELTRALGVPLHEALQPDKWHPIVALIGLRGAGKSTVGRDLARRLERPFAELDGLIEDQVGLGLAEIFAIHGENYYRRLEREVLTQFVLADTPAVLATGGSLVTDRTTFELLKKSAVTIWLRTGPEFHLERVSAQGDRRPMAGRADPLADLRSLLREREPLYSEADITIDTTHLSTAEVASEAVRRLRESESLR